MSKQELLSDAYFLQGSIAHIKGDIEGAIEKFKKCIELDSDYHDAYLYLSVLYNELEQWNVANSYMNKYKGRY